MSRDTALVVDLIEQRDEEARALISTLLLALDQIDVIESSTRFTAEIARCDGEVALARVMDCTAHDLADAARIIGQGLADSPLIQVLRIAQSLGDHYIDLLRWANDE